MLRSIILNPTERMPIVVGATLHLCHRRITQGIGPIFDPDRVDIDRGFPRAQC
jgi:hypothetical protein